MVAFYILIAILLFGILILVHELGHFISAKLSGVQVNEFALFMGPAIWKKQKGETLYALRCIPIGGYCAMEGEDGNSDNPRAFSKAKVWKRLIILAAGSFMNFVAGFLIMLMLISFSGFFEAIPGKQLGPIREGRPYENVLQEGDEFYAINGERIYVKNAITMFLERDTDNFYDITVIRNGEKVLLKDVEMRADYVYENGSVGYGLDVPNKEKTVGNVLSYTWNTTRFFVQMVRVGLVDLFTGNAKIQDAAGPVGIVEAVVQQGVQSETVGIGLFNVFNLFAFIAVNLAVMNILPIPALDGGRIACLLITAAVEKIIGRKLDPKYEGYLHGIFMVLLLAFIALITFKDILHLFGG